MLRRSLSALAFLAILSAAITGQVAPPVCEPLDPATIVPVRLLYDFDPACADGLPGSSDAFPLGTAGPSIFVSGGGNDLWVTRGTEETTTHLKTFESL
jgi:hypothetical protein